MKEISIVQLILPDGRIVLQRRDNNARINPGLLGFFGGHVEDGETPEVALRREISEETSLDTTELMLEYLANEILPHPNDNTSKIKVHFYKTYIESDNFEVFEGQQAESYSVSEMRERQDLSPNVIYLIDHFAEA